MFWRKHDRKEPETIREAIDEYNNALYDFFITLVALYTSVPIALSVDYYYTHIMPIIIRTVIDTLVYIISSYIIYKILLYIYKKEGIITK